MNIGKAKYCIAIMIFSLTLTQAEAAEYKVDAAHSQIGFKIRHLGISNVTGLFGDYDATFTFDPKAIEKSQAAAHIKSTSINTDNTKRDDHLRSDDFFHVEKHPAITFKTKEIKSVSGDKFDVLGDLSMHGVTLPIKLNATYNGSAKDAWGNDRVAFSAETKINRKDFGLAWNKALEAGGLLVGEEVTIQLEIQGIKQ